MCRVATIDAARNFLRTLRKGSSNIQMLGDVEVLIHEGTYGPLTLDQPELDSGTATNQRVREWMVTWEFHEID